MPEGDTPPAPPTLPVRHVGDPLLRRRADTVADDDIGSMFVQDLVFEMHRAMRSSGGVGLAAPQVGESVRIVVLEDPESFLTHVSAAKRTALARKPLVATTLINPVVISTGDDQASYYEGCLSIPGLVAMVARDLVVDVDSADAEGRRSITTFSGWAARIVQHEIDHLDGILFTDRMLARTLTTPENLRRHVKSRSSGQVLELMGERASL